MFIHANSLQALKLGAVLGLPRFGIVGVAGLLPNRGLNSLLILAFFLMILTLVVGAEALLAGCRLDRTVRYPLCRTHLLPLTLPQDSHQA